MIRNTLLAFALVACMSLSACDGSGDGDGGGDLSNPGGGPVDDGGDLPSQFGGRFADIFNQPATADPVDVQPGDAGVLDFTTDPVEF